jgi:hypothetical protein
MIPLTFSAEIGVEFLFYFQVSFLVFFFFFLEGYAGENPPSRNEFFSIYNFLNV